MLLNCALSKNKSFRIARTYLIHLLVPFSRFSTIYPVMGLPPSFLGGSQAKVMESSVVSVASGVVGLPGGSNNKEKIRLIVVLIF